LPDRWLYFTRDPPVSCAAQLVPAAPAARIVARPCRPGPTPIPPRTHPRHRESRPLTVVRPMPGTRREPDGLLAGPASFAERRGECVFTNLISTVRRPDL